MPQYAILLYGPIERGEAIEGAAEAHDQHSKDLQADGSMIAAFALESYETATSLRADGMTDGPFIEAKEVILGLCIVEAADLDAALAIARRNPILRQSGGVEVRPVEDFVITRTS